MLDLAIILAYTSAFFAAALAVAIAWYERRSLAHWFFVAGMAALAAESSFSGLTADALLPEEMVHWQNWRLLAMSFLPVTWLSFSLTYARGNYREFLSRWRFLLAAAIVVPVGLVLGFHGQLVISIAHPAPDRKSVV